MSDLQVIYDPNLELGAIIDMDTREALPCAAAGPHARDILEAFVNSASWDIGMLSTSALGDAYSAFLSSVGLATEPEATQGPDASQDASGGDGMAEAALAEATATATAAGPPEPAPADTDMGADQGATLTKVRCFNCEGAGVLKFGDGSPDQKCNTCDGTGTLLMPAA